MFNVGCITICLAHSIDHISPRISPRTRDLLAHFGKLMKQKGVKLKNLDEKVYHATHLALTHIQIQQLKTELKELEKRLHVNTNQEENIQR